MLDNLQDMTPSTELDPIDTRLLAALQDKPQISNRELAEKVGLPVSTCHARVRSLWERGVIRGQRLDLDPEAMGRKTNALLRVRIRAHTRPVVDEFFEYALSLPEVVQVFHVSGAHDFMLHIAVPSTDRLRDFLLDSVTTRKEVGQIETHLVFDQARKQVLEPL
jgi:DNA-binding Lrp family transcriptional regulator